ncbi:hypothetical protein [Hymenobacter sp. UYCo722]|uniref:hypothetical protein n=1 Tax=Hymenobacter sp. UYCo722 TaxID=3156335 RepID=UPI00339722E8
MMVLPHLRRLLRVVAMLALPLAVSQCGGRDNPRPAAQATYSARFSISGIGSQPGVDMPRVALELMPCSPVNGQLISTNCGPRSSNLLVNNSGSYWYTSNQPTTTTAITGGSNLSGQTLYLIIKFEGAYGDPPGPNAVVTLELLGQSAPNQPVQTVQTLVLTAADAQLAANRYNDGGLADIDVIKYVKVVIP